MNNNNTEYWTGRLNKEVKATLHAQEKDTLKFLQAYKKSLAEIQILSSNLYAQYSVDGVLTMAEMYKLNRYKDMQQQITSIMDKLGQEEKMYMTRELTSIYSASYIKTGELLVKAAPNIGISFTAINQGAVEKALTYPWSGSDFSSRIWKNKDKLITNLEQTLTKGFINGSSISKMTKELNGVMNVGAGNCRRLIRTESMHTMASAHHDSYTQAGVEKVKFITADDDRVCADCDLMNGDIFDLNDAPMIPQHANSRSIIIPYFED